MVGFDVGLFSNLYLPEGGKLIGGGEDRKFLVLMILQFRMAAIAILGSKVLKKRGLTGLSYDSLEFCREEIREVRRSYF